MDYYNFLIQSTEKMKQCRNDWALKDIFQQAIEELGFSQFIYIIYTLKKMKFVHAIYTFDEAWTNLYAENRFEEIDPVFIRAVSEKDAFFWDADDYGEGREMRRYSEISKKHSHYYGVTTPFQLYNDNRAIVTVSAGERSPAEKKRASCPRNITLISALSACFLQVALTHFGKPALTLKPIAESILKLSEMGLTTKQISLILDKSPNYIDEIFKGLFSATGIRSRTALISFLRARNLM